MSETALRSTIETMNTLLLDPLPSDRAGSELRFYQFGEEFVHKPIGVVSRRYYQIVDEHIQRIAACESSAECALSEAFRESYGKSKAIVEEYGLSGQASASVHHSWSALRAADAPKEYFDFYRGLQGKLPKEDSSSKLFVERTCNELYRPIPLLDILYGIAYRVGVQAILHGIPPM